MAQPSLIGRGWWSIVTRPSPMPISRSSQRLKSAERSLPNRSGVLVVEETRKAPSWPRSGSKDLFRRNLLRNGTFALAMIGSAAFLVNPSFGAEPDSDSPVVPALVASDLPDFQLDWACCDDRTANDVDAPDVVVLDD